ncbi:MAG: FkbM family methyltransferase [Candidatus Baldrarchaeia archaeon]
MASKSVLNSLKKLSGALIIRHDFRIAGYVTMDYLACLLKLYSLRDHTFRFRCECGYTFNAKLRDWWRFFSHFEPKTSAFLRKNVSREDTVIDIGAHIGIHTIHLAKVARFVYAIEPEPTNLKLLIKNILVNNVKKKVIVLPYAISSVNGIVNFYVSSESTGAHHILSNDEGNIGRGTILKVRAYTLDTLVLDTLGIDHVDVVKIDVEGHELEVIKGAQKLFQCSSPRIIVVETKRNSELLKILTNKYGYKLACTLDCYGNVCNYAFFRY